MKQPYEDRIVREALKLCSEDKSYWRFRVPVPVAVVSLDEGLTTRAIPTKFAHEIVSEHLSWLTQRNNETTLMFNTLRDLVHHCEKDVAWFDLVLVAEIRKTIYPIERILSERSLEQY